LSSFSVTVHSVFSVSPAVQDATAEERLPGELFVKKKRRP